MVDERTQAVDIEEIGIREDIYSDALINELFRQLDTNIAVFLVESEAQRVSGFLVGVDRVDEVLSPNVTGTVWS